MRDGGADIANSSPALLRRTRWHRSSTLRGTMPTSTLPRRSSVADAYTESLKRSVPMRPEEGESLDCSPHWCRGRCSHDSLGTDHSWAALGVFIRSAYFAQPVRILCSTSR